MAEPGKCRYCYSQVDPRASVCPHCGKRIKTSSRTIGCFVTIMIFVFLLIIGGVFFKNPEQDKPKLVKDANGNSYYKAPEHKVSDVSAVKPVLHIRALLDVKEKSIRAELDKQLGASAEIRNVKQPWGMEWSAKTSTMEITVLPYKGKVLDVMVHFNSPVADRAVALALVDLQPANRPPTSDPVGGPRWDNAFEGIDKIMGVYKPMGGPGVIQITITPNKALYKKWTDEGE